jgi:hypothetical protein
VGDDLEILGRGDEGAVGGPFVTGAERLVDHLVCVLRGSLSLESLILRRIQYPG